MEGETQVSESASTPVDNAPAPATETSPSVSHGTEPSQESNGKPSGFDPVEFTPEQKARVDRLYGNMKRYESGFRELNDVVIKQNEELANLRNGQTQIVNHLQTSNYTEAESNLRAERTAAWNKGDVDAFNTANDKLSEIRVKKELAATRVQTQPQQQSQQQRPSTSERLVNEGLDQGKLTAPDANIARAWMMETDTSGNLKRPWTNENDPRNYAAALEGQAVFNSPLFADKSVADKLREIDRRMGIQAQQTGGQNVLPPGNLTRGAKTSNIKLTPEIERIAVKLKFGGSKAKTDQDHIDAWKRAAAKSQTKGATR